MFARRLIDALQRRSFKVKPSVPNEPRLIYVQRVLFYGLAAPLTALAAAELMFYAVTGQVAGMINIGGRPLGEPR